MRAMTERFAGFARCTSSAARQRVVGSVGGRESAARRDSRLSGVLSFMAVCRGEDGAEFFQRGVQAGFQSAEGDSQDRGGVLVRHASVVAEEENGSSFFGE